MQLWIRLLLQGLLPFCRDVLLSPRYTCGVVGVTGSEGTIHLDAFEWIKIAGGVGARLWSPHVSHADHTLQVQRIRWHPPFDASVARKGICWSASACNTLLT